MKVKINEWGNLEIERAGKFKGQACPLTVDVSSDGDSSPCGDWCPLFGEPYLDEENYHIVIDLCKDYLSVHEDDFIDERS